MSQDRRYDFASYEDEYRGADIRDDDSGRGPLILALAIGVLIVFAAVVWNTYRQGVREEDGELPMVMADTEPYKHTNVHRLRRCKSGVGHVRCVVADGKRVPASSSHLHQR